MGRRSRAVRAPGPEPPGRAARASSSSRSRRACATWLAESARCRRGVQPFFDGLARRLFRSCSRSPTALGTRPDRRRTTWPRRRGDAVGPPKVRGGPRAAARRVDPPIDEAPAGRARDHAVRARDRVAAFLAASRSPSTTTRSTSRPVGVGPAGARGRAIDPAGRGRQLRRGGPAHRPHRRRARGRRPGRPQPGRPVRPVPPGHRRDGSLGGYGAAAWGGARRRSRSSGRCSARGRGHRLTCGCRLRDTAGVNSAVTRTPVGA